VSDYLDLADAEIKLQLDARTSATSGETLELVPICLGLLRNMQQYQGAALAAYKHHAEQLSLVRLSRRVHSHFAFGARNI